jgi:hypothetical protein
MVAGLYQIGRAKHEKKVPATRGVAGTFLSTACLRLDFAA